MAKWEKSAEEQKEASTAGKDAAIPGGAPPSQLKVPGSPAATDVPNEAKGIVDPDAVAHSHIDIAGGIPDEADDEDTARSSVNAPRRPRHVDIHAHLPEDKRAGLKTVKCVVTSGQIMVREADGSFVNYPAGTTFDAPRGHVAGYLAAGNVEKA